MALIYVFCDYAFGIVMDSHGMRVFAIHEFTNESDIIFLVETWERDLKIQGLGNYNIDSFIWVKITRKQRGQGVACLIKRE